MRNRWKELTGPDKVVAHAAYRRRRGKNPSMGLGKLGNPREALEFARVAGEVIALRRLGQDDGVPLVDQVLMYKHRIAPLPVPAREDRLPGELDSTIRALSRSLDYVAESRSIVELQRNIVIGNVNEFRLRYRPTSEEFGALVKDYCWRLLRTKNHWGKGKRKRQQIYSLLHQLVEALWKRYDELTSLA